MSKWSRDSSLESRVLLGVYPIGGGCEHADGATALGDRGRKGNGIDACGEPAHHGNAPFREKRCEIHRAADSFQAGIPPPDDRDPGTPLEEVSVAGREKGFRRGAPARPR